MALTRIQTNALQSAITSGNIADGTIVAGDLASGAVTAPKLAAGSVENYMATAGTNFMFRNKFINGNMVIDQRNTGASVTMSTNSTVFAVDRTMVEQGGCTSNTGTAQQVTDAPTGFPNSLKYTAGTSSYNSTGFCAINQRIEGYNVQDFAFGTPSAQSVTLSFWVKSSLTGTFTINMTTYNGTTERWNNQTYTVNAANTWEYKTLTFVGDTVSGPSNNTTGFMRVYWHLGGDSAAMTSTSFNSWFNGTGTKRAATTQVNLLGTSGATFQLTGIQLEAGAVATPFERRPYSIEMDMCQRYYWRTDANTTAFQIGQGFIRQTGTTAGQSHVTIQVPYPVPMRTRPTVSLAAAGTFEAQVGNTGAPATFMGNWSASGNQMGWVDFDLLTTNTFSIGQAVSVYTYTVSRTGQLQWSAEL